MTYWRCSNCRYTITAARPPEECPSCQQKTDFLNITCYAPECGGPGQIDPRL
ncbi:MAG: rubredoxin-like domain-containing protein [Desulfobaccales bacterium]